eukprot:4304180-Pleurochrysis_carterae.AAC.4
MLCQHPSNTALSASACIYVVNGAGEGEKMLVVAPTRELAVQLANEAAGLVTDPSEVQIIAIGATPLPQARQTD